VAQVMAPLAQVPGFWPLQAALLLAVAQGVLVGDQRRGRAHNEVSSREQAKPVLGALDKAACGRLLDETYGALKGWGPKVAPLRRMCSGLMAQQASNMKLEGSASSGQVCEAFAQAAVATRVRVQKNAFPSLQQLKDSWCRPVAPAAASPASNAKPALSRMAAIAQTVLPGASASFDHLNTWWHGRSNKKEVSLSQISVTSESAKKAMTSLIDEFPTHAVPGSALAVASANLAVHKGSSMLQMAKTGAQTAATSVYSGFWNTLDFLCDDDCGLSTRPQPDHLRVVR